MAIQVIKIVFGLFIFLAVSFVFFGAAQAFFSDNETSEDNVISTSSDQSTLVINEVYYDPDSSHMEGEDPNENDFEWVEIYNPTDYTVNLKDWKILDNSTERLITSSDRNLAPGEFVILGKAENVRIIWSIEAEKFIPIGQKLGNGLANVGDRVILKDDEENVIDQISYGSDDTILNPSITDVSEGHSIERNPDGLDSDSATDFVDMDIPTPGT